ncbi:hypothetical protein [Laspinema olomoucense]|uniref:hypothetical protein n=1 Tax=Laspinema olomoucense TaxID=3231600 RepID=UPI0021BB28CF|nr:hypothetical protein [Laspinema sp. D3d]MCT7971113.1 hypothetical protein [Laspinema sp. D3d]
MIFYPHKQPILSPKPDPTTLQFQQGLWLIHVQIRGKTIFRQFYTRVDQSLMVWAVVTATIFFTAQSGLNWTIQAIAGSILTGAATVIMWNWTHVWVMSEQVQWLIYCWLGLMLGGIALTDASLVWGWSLLLLPVMSLMVGDLWIGLFGNWMGLKISEFPTRSFLPFLGHGNFTSVQSVAISAYWSHHFWDLGPIL